MPKAMIPEGTPSVAEAAKAVGDASTYLRVGKHATAELLSSIGAAARGGLMGWEQVRAAAGDKPELRWLVSLADSQVRAWQNLGNQTREARARATSDVLTKR